MVTAIELARITRCISSWLRTYARDLDDDFVATVMCASRMHTLELESGTRDRGVIWQFEALAFEALLLQRAKLHWLFMFKMDPLISPPSAPMQIRHRVIINGVDVTRILAGLCDRVCMACAPLSAEIPRVERWEECLHHIVLRDHQMDRTIFGHEVRSMILRDARSPPDMVHSGRYPLLYDLWDAGLY